MRTKLLVPAAFLAGLAIMAAPADTRAEAGDDQDPTYSYRGNLGGTYDDGLSHGYGDPYGGGYGRNDGYGGYYTYDFYAPRAGFYGPRAGYYGYGAPRRFFRHPYRFRGGFGY